MGKPGLFCQLVLVGSFYISLFFTVIIVHIVVHDVAGPQFSLSIHRLGDTEAVSFSCYYE